MRFIRYRPANLNLRNDWSDDAAAVLQDLKNEPDPVKRGEIIKNHAALWAEVKQELSRLSNGKCWYTEAKQVGTDTDVDHFRPKRRVSELKNKGNQHPGYWWLAFDLSNYRFSCIYANRRRRDVETDHTGGKADHFPIWAEASRAWCPEDDCDNEEPLLLDPSKLADTKLLMFKPDGEAMPRYNEESDPKKFKRASESIELYNLNHGDFVKSRVDLRDEVAEQLELAEKYYRKLETEGQTASDAYSDALERLQAMTDAASPFSMFCLEMIKPKQAEEFLDGVAFG